MVTTFHDPLDQLEIKRRHAGESIFDLMNCAGYISVVVRLMAFVGCLGPFGTGHHARDLTAGAAAIFAVAQPGVARDRAPAYPRHQKPLTRAIPDVRKQRPAS